MQLYFAHRGFHIQVGKTGQESVKIVFDFLGDMLEINLDHDRPATFDSKEAEVQWERATAKNALKFKEKVESGVFIPEEILKKLNDKVERTEQEEEILKKEKKLSIMNEKVNDKVCEHVFLLARGLALSSVIWNFHL